MEIYKSKDGRFQIKVDGTEARISLDIWGLTGRFGEEELPAKLDAIRKAAFEVATYAEFVSGLLKRKERGA